MRSRFAVLLILLIVACAETAEPVPGNLDVVAQQQSLQLTNQGSAPIYVFVIEANTAMVANWAPCNDPASCGGIESGKPVTLAYTGISGYAPGAREAIVYWWHLVRGGSGYQPDSVRTVRVGLQ